MEISILIAKITVVIYLSAFLCAFSDRDYYRRLANDMYKYESENRRNCGMWGITRCE